MYLLYIRASSNKQVASPARQYDATMKKFKELVIDKDEEPYVVSEVESATKVPWTERNGFQELVGKAHPGDTIIIWRLDRFDTNAMKAISAIQWMAENKITLVCCEDIGGVPLDFSTLQGRIMAMTMCMTRDVWMHMQSQAIKEGHARRAAKGLHMTGYPPLGMVRVKTIDDDGQIVISYEFDTHALALARWIWGQKYVRGMNPCIMAELLNANDQVGHTGCPLVRRYKAGTKRCNGAGQIVDRSDEWRYDRMQDLVRWLTKNHPSQCDEERELIMAGKKRPMPPRPKGYPKNLGSYR